MDLGTAVPWSRSMSAAPPWHPKIPRKPCPREGEGQSPSARRTRPLSLLASCILTGDYWSAQTSPGSPEQHKAREAPTVGSQNQSESQHPSSLSLMSLLLLPAPPRRLTLHPSFILNTSRAPGPCKAWRNLLGKKRKGWGRNTRLGAQSYS